MGGVGRGGGGGGAAGGGGGGVKRWARMFVRRTLINRGAFQCSCTATYDRVGVAEGQAVHHGEADDDDVGRGRVLRQRQVAACARSTRSPVNVHARA